MALLPRSRFVRIHWKDSKEPLVSASPETEKPVILFPIGWLHHWPLASVLKNPKYAETINI